MDQRNDVDIPFQHESVSESVLERFSDEIIKGREASPDMKQLYIGTYPFITVCELCEQWIRLEGPLGTHCDVCNSYCRVDIEEFYHEQNKHIIRWKPSITIDLRVDKCEYKS